MFAYFISVYQEITISQADHHLAIYIVRDKQAAVYYTNQPE
jgi:hypothetical protein